LCVALLVAFVDADKTGYDAYYERCLTLLRAGGLLAVDNTLWNGAVADPAEQGESTRAIRALNQKIASDPRVSASLVPIGDGLYLARKR
jgi:predicted O-methyltransferase YrrM